VRRADEVKLFAPEENAHYREAMKALDRSRNRQLKELVPHGFAIHHAGVCVRLSSSVFSVHRGCVQERVEVSGSTRG
jgi:hypothetical protein